MTGHAFLKKEFNIKPRVAWHCDPFGHSASTPELFSELGFESIFFSRVDDDEKAYRKKT